MITKLTYNWHQNGDQEHGLGEDYYIAEVGKVHCIEKLEVRKIEEHSAGGEGDKWYYDVYFIDGSIMRVFNPNTTNRINAETNF